MRKHIQRLVKNVIKTKWTTGRMLLMYQSFPTNVLSVLKRQDSGRKASAASLIL